MSRRKPTLVIGIDPGNDRSGVSFWALDPFATNFPRQHELLASATIAPWKDSVVGKVAKTIDDMDDLFDFSRVRIYVEQSAHGTHATREGIAFAGGMLVGQVLRMFPGDVKRGHVNKIFPGEWRKHFGIKGKGRNHMKEQAELEAHDLGATFESDDEAEAILIGLYGCSREE